MLRKIKHTLGQHSWQRYATLGGPTERVCIHPECDRVEEWKDGEWKEKKQKTARK